MGGDPELEAADRANQGAVPSQEEGSDEDEWTPKDAKDLAKKQKQMAKSGITFTSKVGPEAKVEFRRLYFSCSENNDINKVFILQSLLLFASTVLTHLQDLISLSRRYVQACCHFYNTFLLRIAGQALLQSPNVLCRARRGVAEGLLEEAVEHQAGGEVGAGANSCFYSTEISAHVFFALSPRSRSLSTLQRTLKVLSSRSGYTGHKRVSKLLNFKSVFTCFGLELHVRACTA